MKKVIVIGAGITGLSAAWKLSECGHKAIVIESEGQIGGLAKSVIIDDYILDIGPHSFFSEDKEVYDKIVGLFKEEKSELPFSKRTVKMYFKGKYVDYPLSVKSILFQTGILSPILSTLSFIKSYIKTSLNSFKKKNDIDEKNLTIEEWAINNFGKYLFLNFFKPYTEQFWKLKTSELSHKVIPSSKKLDFAKTLKHLLVKKYLEISKREPGKLSLVERESLPSYYPKKGFGEIAKRIGREVLKNNGEILTNCKAQEIRIGEKSLEIITNKQNFICDYVISTIPLNNLIKKFNPKPPDLVLKCSQELKYLSLVLLYIITKKEDVLNCQYCYFIDRPYNRISEMNNFSRETSPKNENLLSVEISCHYKDGTWNLSDQEIYERCIKSIERDELLKKSDVVNFKILRFPSVYPIYKKNYDDNLKEVNKFLDKSKNFYSIGRQGQFYYGDIDQMARFGFDTADKIAK